MLWHVRLTDVMATKAPTGKDDGGPSQPVVLRDKVSNYWCPGSQLI